MKKTQQIKKFVSQLQDMTEAISLMSNNLQETYDNRTEKWQDSEKGEQCMEDIESLNEISSAIELTLDEINTLFE